MILIAWALLLSHQQAIAHAAIGQPGSQLFVVEVIGKSRFNAAGLIERIYLQDYPEAALAPAPRVLGSPEWSAGEAIQVPPAACCARSAQPRISPRFDALSSRRLGKELPHVQRRLFTSIGVAVAVIFCQRERLSPKGPMPERPN